MIDKPGIYSISETLYHSDPCPQPSLSASIAKIVYDKSCHHAWIKHPALNPEREEEHDNKFDLGSAAHRVLLCGGYNGIAFIAADDYRTKAAKAARDAAYEDGMIPMLQKDAERLNQMSSTAMGFLAKTELSGILADGKPEQAIIAQYKGVWLRGLVDWLPTGRGVILDYKTTLGSSKPDHWIRNQLIPLGYDIQAYMYVLLNELTGGPKDAKFVFLVQENYEPYACSLVGAGPSIMASGKMKVDIAISHWRWCLENDEWPGYGYKIAWAEAPAWTLAEAEMRAGEVDNE